MPVHEVYNNGMPYAADDKGMYRPLANITTAEVCTTSKNEENYYHLGNVKCTGVINVPRKSIAKIMAFLHCGAFPEIERKFPKKKKRGTARRMRKWL